MRASLNRRSFLTAAPGAGALTLAFLGLSQSQAKAEDVPTGANGAAPPGFPRQNPELVQSIVGASHANEERVRELLAERPELAKAAWDWGFGDWETALGAASHTGRRAIAELLIANGARPDLFTFTMLGQVDVVRAYIEANPGIQRIPGPHGITLLSHAKAGGAEAEAVLSYLDALGDADVGPRNDPLTDEERTAHVGVYSFGPAESDQFEIVDRRGALGITPSGSFYRGLFNQGEGVFHPAGAPSVQVIFQYQGAQSIAATISIGSDRVRAKRIMG